MSNPFTADFPDVVEIVVEIPRGSRNKYEYDEEADVYRLDRVLSSAVFYNFDYGFIEGTRADDGDHTDALLIIDEPTFTGLSRLGAAHRRPRDARREGLRLQGPVRRGRRSPTSSTSSASSRCARIAWSRSSTSSDLQAARGQGRRHRRLAERERALEVLTADRDRFRREVGG